MTELGRVEDDIFKSRRQDELSFRDRQKRQKFGRNSWHGGRGSYTAPSSGLLAPTPVSRRGSGGPAMAPVTARDVREARQPSVSWIQAGLENQEAAVALRCMLKSSTSGAGKRKQAEDTEDDSNIPTKKKRKGLLGGVDASVIKMSSGLKVTDPDTEIPEVEDESDRIDRCDEVRLWEEGWRTRYYQSKFGVDPEDAPEFCIKVAHEYVIGLCWVLAYYYQVSWSLLVV